MHRSATPFASRPARRLLAMAVLAWQALLAGPVAGQFLEAETVAGDSAPRLGDVRTQRYRVGVMVTADGGPCRGIYASMPVPRDWPEQKVRVVEEDVTPLVKSLRYRELAGDVKQLVVEIPELPAGNQARAIVTFELERAAILPPEDTAGLQPPEKPDRSLRTHLGSSAYIESRDPKVVRFAKDAGQDLDGWAKVEAIYDTVREKVEYRNGDLKGARRALADGWGDCEELTCLFIASCRAEGIPARTVWVEGHCYPEFYLVDAAGAGHWYPCQAAGTRAFGGMPDQLPILQKGDAFRDPDRPGKPLRYVSEFLKGASVAKGNQPAGQPRVTWIREGA
ncbi:MAG: transglutaminase-like domain-containing protein [Planctomycetota bacterium]